VAPGIARVLFRRSLITEQPGKLDLGGSETALEIPSIYFALTRPGPHCLSSFINGDATPRSVREGGSLRACFSQRDTGLEKTFAHPFLQPTIQTNVQFISRLLLSTFHEF